MGWATQQRPLTCPIGLEGGLGLALILMNYSKDFVGLGSNDRSVVAVVNRCGALEDLGGKDARAVQIALLVAPHGGVEDPPSLLQSHGDRGWRVATTPEAAAAADRGEIR